MTNTPSRRLWAVGVAGLLMLLAAASSAAAPSQLDAAADAVVAAGAPGVGVYVRDHNRTAAVTRGYDDLVTKRPASVNDRFRIGSVTKSFVATIVLQLAAQGKLSLDDSVEEYLPGLLANGDAITLRQLLSHRSGLFDYLK